MIFKNPESFQELHSFIRCFPKTDMTRKTQPAMRESQPSSVQTIPRRTVQFSSQQIFSQMFCFMLSYSLYHQSSEYSQNSTFHTTVWYYITIEKCVNLYSTQLY